VAGVIGVATVASTLAIFHSPPASLQVIFIWTLAALAGELMVFPTATGRAHINLATTMHLAMIFVLDPGQVVIVMALSRCIAKFILKRQVWYRALFNVAQATGAVLAASLLYRALGGGTGLEFSLNGLLSVAPAYLAAALAYYAINTGTVSGAVALTNTDAFWRVWRENYGYAAEMACTSSLALFAPVTVLCYQSLGWSGLLIFLFPMALIRVSSVRYIALRKAQQDLVASERLAAKGEIAAEVGHEINNYLNGVYGQIQLLLMKGERLDREEVKNRLESIMGQLENIDGLSKGLVDFSQREVKMIPTLLSELVDTTLAFLRPQNRFDGVSIQTDFDPRVHEVVADPGQMQQAIMNLILNAANAMRESETRNPRISIWTRLHDVTGLVEIGVADSGPGIPQNRRHQVFEPGFTTRKEGHGFGLSTTHRIVANHQGTISVEDAPIGGALFRILLPLQLQRAA